MSAPEDTADLKAGHPPAVKAGGMRITQHKPAKDKTDKDPNSDEGDDHINFMIAPSSPPKVTTVSGAPLRGNADIPADAVKSFHTKPLPTHDARPTSDNKPSFIQQPRK